MLLNILILAAIGLFAAILLALALCTFVCYVRNRPDGVYKTNENLIGYLPSNSSSTKMDCPTIKSVDPLDSSVRHSNGINFSTDTRITLPPSQQQQQKIYSDTNSLFTKEYFC